MIPVFRYVKAAANKLFCVSTANTKRTNGFKLQQRRFKEDIWTGFLAITVVKY